MEMLEEGTPNPLGEALVEELRWIHSIGAGIEKLYLCGITGKPPERAIAKTALGAENTVVWEYADDAVAVIEDLRGRGFEIAAIETTVEHDVIHANGLDMPLVLAGDIHHYNRYASDENGRQRITSGGGAAFLYPTNHLAEAFVVRSAG